MRIRITAALGLRSPTPSIGTAPDVFSMAPQIPGQLSSHTLPNQD